MTRMRVSTPDGDELSVERLEGSADAPRVVLFHGLEGGLHSTYLRGLASTAAARGWWADIVLWRTCDGRIVNNRARAYHSGASDDADAVLSRILASDPHRPTVLIGVSLGGNVMLKWLGEVGASANPSIKAAAAVSVPFDLDVASARTERGFARLYGWFFLRSLKEKTRAKLGRFPEIVDPDVLEQTRTLREFDQAVTAPVNGFADATDYYARASSIGFLPNVAIPTLLFCARNDPFVSTEVLQRVSALAAGNPYLECVFPERGGHVGFVSGAAPWRAHHWMEDYTLDWLARYVDAR